jgi:hypothetical protein
MKNIFLLFLSLALASCGKMDKQNQSGFEAFYQRFHADSIFQMDHILFPLPGVPAMVLDGDLDTTYYWQEGEWLMHHDFDAEALGYTRQWRNMGSIVEEEICDLQGNCLERRFMRDGDAWQLIFYKGMNKTYD